MSGQNSGDEGTFKGKTADAPRTNNPESGEWCQKGFGRSTLAREQRFLLFVCCFVFGDRVSLKLLKPVQELALADQAGLELTEICLPLSPQYWD